MMKYKSMIFLIIVLLYLNGGIKSIFAEQQGYHLLFEPSDEFETVEAKLSNDYYQVRKGNKFGVCDKDGKLVTDIIYNLRMEYVNGKIYASTEFYHPLAMQGFKFDVRIDPKTGNVQKLMDELDLRHSHILPSTYERYMVEYREDPKTKQKMVGLVNLEGETIIPFGIYQELHAIYGQDMYLGKLNGKIGVINHANELIIPFEYDRLTYEKGYFLAQKEKLGLIDLQNNMIIPFSYNYIQVLKNDIFRVSDKQDYWGVLNRNNEFIKPITKINYHFQHLRNDYYYIYTDKKMGIADKFFNITIPIEYDQIELLNSGNYVVCKEGKWGVVDGNNNIMIPLEYDELKSMYGPNEKFTAIKDDQWGAIVNGKFMADQGINSDKPNNHANEFEEFLEDEWEQVCYVKKNGLWGLLDSDKNVLIPCEYDWIDYYGMGFHRGRDERALSKAFVVEKNGKQGYVDRSNQVVFPFVYDKIKVEYPYVIAVKDGLYGVVTMDNEMVLPFNFVEVLIEDQRYQENLLFHDLVARKYIYAISHQEKCNILDLETMRLFSTEIPYKVVRGGETIWKSIEYPMLAYDQQTGALVGFENEGMGKYPAKFSQVKKLQYANHTYGVSYFGKGTVVVIDTPIDKKVDWRVEIDDSKCYRGKEGRAMILLKEFAEKFDAYVEWSKETDMITIITGEKTVCFPANQPLPNNMGRVEVKNGNTYIPLRYVAEQFGAQLTWIEKEQIIHIIYQPKSKG